MTVQTSAPPASDHRDLDPLIRPRSIAIIGASGRPASLGGRPLRRLLEHGFDGPIWPVNPNHDEIDGVVCVPSVELLPEPADVALVVTPAGQVVTALEAAAAKGIPAAIVISSGFSELASGDGAAAQTEIGRIARTNGMTILGPNCVGLVNFVDGIPLTFGTSGDLAAGRRGIAGVVSQSGALTTCIANRLFDVGVGANVAVSTGNEADLDAIEVLAALADEPSTRVLVAVLEEVRDGPGLVALARRLHERSIPLVVSKVGRTDAGATAVQSHTGSLAGSYRVLEAVLQREGVLLAENLDELIDLTMVAAQGRALRGTGVAVLSVSGGAGAMAADAASDLGIPLPAFRPSLSEHLATMLPGFASGISNPIDTTPQALSDTGTAAELVRSILADPDIDAMVAITPGASGDRDEAVRRRLALVAETDKPFVEVVLAGSDGAAMRTPLLDGGVPVFSTPDAALRSLKRLRGWYRAGERAAPDLTAAQADAGLREQVDAILAATADLRTSDVATKVLTAAGVRMVGEGVAFDTDEAVAVADRLGYPVVVKVRSPDLPHKTEVDGIRVGLRDAEQVADAVRSVEAAAVAAASTARLDGVLVQQMVDARVELIAGVRHDETFGPTVVLGLGGVWAEVFDDVALRPAPLGPEDAADMVASLRGAPLLSGARGLPPVSSAELERLLLGLAAVALATSGRLSAIDCNPVALCSDGTLTVLDATLFPVGAAAPTVLQSATLD